MKTGFKAETIEKMDRARHCALKWVAVSYVVSYLPSILLRFDFSRPFMFYLALLSSVGGILFLIFILRMLRISRRIKSDFELRSALNNEMYVGNVLKSFRWAFFTMLAALVVLTVIASWLGISAENVCSIVIFVGVTTFLSAALIYNR